MKRIYTYSRNIEYGASAYYRIIQYMNKIDGQIANNSLFSNKMFAMNQGKKYRGLLYLLSVIRVLYFMLYDMIIYKGRIVVISREMFIRHIPLIIKPLLKSYLKKRYVIWDFDDNIVFSQEISNYEFHLLSRYSSRITVTNKYLKDLIPEQFHDKVILLPTTDSAFSNEDTEMIIKNREKTYSGKINIVWVGTASNLEFLNDIAGYLDKAAYEIKKASNKQTELNVICNKYYSYSAGCLIINNIMWSREKAKKGIEQAHIGIMPLRDNKFTRGKGAFKIIQYFSSGLPAVASDVGFNAAAVENDINGFLLKHNDYSQDWVNAIVTLATDIEKWRIFSRNARITWENKFSYQSNLNQWQKILSCENEKL